MQISFDVYYDRLSITSVNNLGYASAGLVLHFELGNIYPYIEHN